MAWLPVSSEGMEKPDAGLGNIIDKKLLPVSEQAPVAPKEPAPSVCMGMGSMDGEADIAKGVKCVRWPWFKSVDDVDGGITSLGRNDGRPSCCWPCGCPATGGATGRIDGMPGIDCGTPACSNCVND
mmetsp:Transcript_30907/g.82027  ORF Transcript_30907/g.82027 Transcript_30907/m.82027 type:complete len:127 (+) Transcript_30907:1150-1530(+)